MVIWKEATWQWWCICRTKCGLHRCIERLRTLKVLLHTDYGITWATTKAYTPNVKSEATIFLGWCLHIDSWVRGHLLPNFPFETRWSHLTDWFSRGRRYYSGVDRPSLHSWDKDIGEENTHKSSDGWTSTDCIVYHAESGGNPKSASARILEHICSLT